MLLKLSKKSAINNFFPTSGIQGENIDLTIECNNFPLHDDDAMLEMGFINELGDIIYPLSQSIDDNLIYASFSIPSNANYLGAITYYLLIKIIYQLFERRYFL